MAEQTPVTDPMTEAALRSLKDIAIPEPISWMPQTWGWALVAGLLAVITLVLGLRRLRRYRANAYRREALLLLHDIEEKISDPARRHDGVHDLAELLKRVALAGWPREEVATISGASWVKFLGEHGNPASAHLLASLLDDFEYQGNETLDTIPANVGDDWTSSARRWIEGHRVSA